MSKFIIVYREYEDGNLILKEYFLEPLNGMTSIRADAKLYTAKQIVKNNKHDWIFDTEHDEGETVITTRIVDVETDIEYTYPEFVEKFVEE